MYSSGVFHWETEKSHDIDYWLDLIHKVKN
jgi:hypothetical protein